MVRCSVKSGRLRGLDAPQENGAKCESRFNRLLFRVQIGGRAPGVCACRPMARAHTNKVQNKKPSLPAGARAGGTAGPGPGAGTWG